MVEPVISIQGLTKRYRDHAAVRDLSFSVERGRVVGLLGRNGAGKTTTLRCLLGLTAPTSGECRILGSPYPLLPGAARRVGVSLDEMSLLGGLSVRAETGVWARYIGVDLRRVDEVLELVGLADTRRKRVKALSTGMQKRLSLAIALLADPEVLILDEPLNGLDPDGIRWMRRLLRDHADAGGTVLVSSHLMAEMQETVDEVIVLQESLRFQGSLEDATAGGTVSLEDRFFEIVGG